MKKIILVVFTSLLLASAASAQDRGYTMSFSASVGTPSLNHSKGMMPIEIKTDYGYMFNSWFTLRGHLDLNIANMKYEGDKSSDTFACPAIGAGVGFTVFNNLLHRVELVGYAGSTIGGDYTYAFGDASARWAYGSGTNKLLVGGGIKLYNSYKSEYIGSANLYISIGYRFK